MVKGDATSATAKAERAWGAKALFGSDFADVASCLDVLLDRVPESDLKPFSRMSAATLKMALLDAEDEVVTDPDAIGPEQHALLHVPREDDAIDMIALHCEAIGLDPEIFRTSSATVLDRLADRVRAEREQPSAQVLSIAEARERRERIDAFDRSLIFLVQKGRFAGQYALAI